MTDTIVITPTPPVVINVTPSPEAPPDSGIIRVDGSRVGPPGPALPIVFHKQGTAVVLTGASVYRFPFACTLIGMSAAMGRGTPPVGSDLTADLVLNGTPVATITVVDGEQDAEELTLTVPCAIGDHLSVDITQVGSTSPGSNFATYIRYAV